ECIADLHAQFLGQRGVDDDLAALRRSFRPPPFVLYLPKCFIAADYKHSSSQPLALGTFALRCRSRKQNGRDNLSIRAVMSQFGGEVVPKEPIEHKQLINPAQAIENEVPQAAADRIADDQG